VVSSLRHHRRRSAVVLGLFLSTLSAIALAASSGFVPQTRLGFRTGDQWEPAIAADGYGHVYVLYPQYGHNPGCLTCPSPSLVLVVSNDNGISWEAPRAITPPDSAQFDAQIVVDPLDRRTVYAAWVQNNKYDVVVAKSADFGQSWSLALADRSPVGTDKPVLTVRGRDVYVGFTRGRRLWVASSHDGGISFALAGVTPRGRLRGAVAGGGTVDPAGNVYFSWVGYPRSVAAGESVDLNISKSSDGGVTWSTLLLDLSGAPPDCSAYFCEEDYLGAQVALTSDSAGTLYALWNSSPQDKAPGRVYFASSTTAGATWSPRLSISSAAADVEHAFPALVAGSAGDVRIAWMDSRNRPLWNTYYRSSTNGGATWSPEQKLSSFAPGYWYIQREGFRFPFGDYFEMDIDSHGQTQAVWGKGYNFKTPGSIWHVSRR